jgi:demethylmenaquinone methyltransferase/2-methoxy-6-polyprenyl-1,4-benzoquinol methylase
MGASHKDPQLIQSMFGKIAKRYDLTNSVLSFKLHYLWNKRLIQSIQAENSLLDLCAGTGEIAYGWLTKQIKPKQVILLDFCQEMLEVAKTKMAPYVKAGHTIKCIQADATSIPLPSQSVDAISIAYGIRNVQNPLKCYQEAHRLLKSHGQLTILELTEPSNPLIKSLHHIYLTQILPRMGGFITGEKEAYRYLSESIPAFSKPETMRQELLQAGFTSVAIRPITGGIATLIEAKK